MKYEYITATGKTEIEVDESFGELLVSMDRDDYNDYRRETRRHCSLEAFNLDDTYFPSDVNVENDVIRNENRETLEAAITKLLPEQQCLIHEIYIKGIPAVELARREGVYKSAISNRLSRALKSLKKILE